jgi:hypothetical protein
MILVTPNVDVVYVCTDCGKHHPDINQLDGKCQENAQLCYASSLQVRQGRVALARAVHPQSVEWSL